MYKNQNKMSKLQTFFIEKVKRTQPQPVLKHDVH